MSVLAYQRDYFYGTETATRQGRAPQVDVSFTDRPIGRSRIYAGANAQMAYLIQKPDINAKDFDQNLLRFDAAPRVRVPLSSLPFLSATASASLRVTHWRESIDLVQDAQVPVPITRSLFDIRTDVLGPVLAKIWTPANSGYAERFKHLIEPRVSFQWLSPFAARRSHRADRLWCRQPAVGHDDDRLLVDQSAARAAETAHRSGRWSPTS